MPAYKGIGKLENAIRSGIKAYQSVNYGAVPNPNISNPNTSTKGGFRGTWGAIPFNVNVFVWGVHKWGSKTNRVGQ